MTPRILLVLALSFPAAAPSHATSPAPSASLASVSGAELVQQLHHASTRARAFHELWRRAKPENTAPFSEFTQDHYNLEVVVCPQGPARSPLLLVLYDYLSPLSFTGEDDYPITAPDALFPPAPVSRDAPTSRPAFAVFTADGKLIAPFGGNNVLEGALADVNGDGILERVEVSRLHFDGVDNVAVLEVSSVKPEPEPLLAVLINWGRDEWSFRLRDNPARNLPDIEIGPRTADGLKPKAVFQWDAQTRAFTGPRGQAGDHFRQLEPTSGDYQKQLKRLHAAKLKFPQDPDFAPSVRIVSGQKTEKPTPPAARPYQRRSLADLSHADLLNLMLARDRSAHDFEYESIVKNHLPSDFWSLPPQEAARALVEAHRSPQHRARYQLALDDRLAERPPEIGTLTFSDASSRCYVAADAFYFVRADPAGSYLAYAGTSSGGVVFYNIVFDQPAFDLRVCPLPYEDARHLLATIGWLDRLRSRDLGDPTNFPNMTISTADGTGVVTVRDATGAVLIDREKTLWSSPLSDRWSGPYDQTSFVNFSAYLVAGALTQRLGAAWSSAAPAHAPHIAIQEKRTPSYTEEEHARVAALVRRFLSDFTPAQDRVSNVIAASAAEAAGTLVIADTRPLLEKLLASLPPESSPPRTYDDVFTEYYKVLRTPAPDPKSRAAREEAERALSSELAAIRRYESVHAPAHLRRVATVALRKIESARNPDALHTWAISEEDGNQWALQQLARIDTPRYAQALEQWLKTAKGKRARQIFDELRRVAPERATALADTRPAEKADALTADIFEHLQQSGRPLDDPAHLDALLAVLQNPKSGWEQRRKAIDLLVPPDDPLRFPQRKVDDALLRVLKPDQADDVINFTLPSACRALALRQRSEHFDRIAALLDTKQNVMVSTDVISSLVLLAQHDPARFNPRIAKILSPHLKTTERRMNDILWAIWSANLRDFQPDMERLGTSGPDDYQDSKASGSGDGPTVRGRFHLARKIADVWNASDPVTEIRLLTALALSEPYYFAYEPALERLAALKKALHEASRRLTPEQRASLDEFFQAAATLPDEERLRASNRDTILALVKAAL